MGGQRDYRSTYAAESDRDYRCYSPVEDFKMMFTFNQSVIQIPARLSGGRCERANESVIPLSPNQSINSKL